MNWQCLDAHSGLGTVPWGRDTVDCSVLVELTGLSEGPQRSPHFLLFRQLWGRGTEMNPQLLEDEVGTCIIIVPRSSYFSGSAHSVKRMAQKAALSTARFIGREWFKGANFKSFTLNLCGFFQRVYQEKKYIYSVKCPQFSYSIIPFFLMGRDFTMGNPFSLTHWNHSLKIRISSSSPKCWHIYQTCSWEGLTDTPSSIQLFTSWSIQWMGSACNSCGNSHFSSDSYGMCVCDHS